MAFHYIKNFPRYTGIHLFLPFPLSILPSSREIKQFKCYDAALAVFIARPSTKTFIESRGKGLVENQRDRWPRVNSLTPCVPYLLYP